MDQSCLSITLDNLKKHLNRSDIDKTKVGGNETIYRRTA